MHYIFLNYRLIWNIYKNNILGNVSRVVKKVIFFLQQCFQKSLLARYVKITVVENYSRGGAYGYHWNLVVFFDSLSDRISEILVRQRIH